MSSKNQSWKRKIELEQTVIHGEKKKTLGVESTWKREKQLSQKNTHRA